MLILRVFVIVKAFSQVYCVFTVVLLFQLGRTENQGSKQGHRHRPMSNVFFVVRTKKTEVAWKCIHGMYILGSRRSLRDDQTNCIRPGGTSVLRMLETHFQGEGVCRRGIILGPINWVRDLLRKWTCVIKCVHDKISQIVLHLLSCQQA